VRASTTPRGTRRSSTSWRRTPCASPK
jgi:hypothetical protein